jgi:hypothetical protein
MNSEAFRRVQSVRNEPADLLACGQLEDVLKVQKIA